MNRNLSLGQYFPGHSILHRADPRTKILLSVAFMVLALVSRRPAEFLTLGIFAVCAVFVSRIPLLLTLSAVKPILPLILFASVVNLFMAPGRPLFRLWIFAPTYEGGAIALAMAARILLILLGGSALMIFTTTPILLTDGVEKLLKPLKRFGAPVHELSMMMTIALRFIPTLLEEADKIMRAQASRGADFNEGKLIDRARSFIPIIIPLFVSAFRRADELANAMEARCYRGDEGRTRLRELCFGSLDAALFAAFGL
ncbi:MAG: energy-coupling factor transporter transmembrane protein EcfT, partial [Clostridiales bacterium]|nr:energy-coupling factor transporter transmembrane protein EcfT [Clostridiales bacterium]